MGCGACVRITVQDDCTAVVIGHTRGVPDLRGRKVVQAAARMCSTVLVLEDGTPMAFGSNCSGQSSIPDLRGRKVVQAAAGLDHTVLVLEDGTPMAIGRNHGARKGETSIPDLRGRKVVQAAAGDRHTVLVLEDGTPMAFGSNTDGQTSIPDLRGRKVVQAAAGAEHTVLVLEDGTPMAFGSNFFGQTSIPHLRGRKVVQAAAGVFHTMLVLEDGTPITLGKFMSFGKTSGLPDLRGRKVVQCASGDHHAVLVLEDGTPIAFGKNDSGQTSMPDLRGRKVVQAAAGADHTVLVLEEAAIERKRRSELLGIQLSWVLQDFAKDAQEVMDSIGSFDRPSKNLTFHELAKIMAYGEKSYGKGKFCPRDGQLDCSIVDAVFDKGHSGHASIFLSWCWNYTLSVASDALHEFLMSHEDVDAGTCYVWWCFYQNNQHRILGEDRCMTTDELSIIFGSRLQAIGRMLCLMDKIRGDQYTKRIWCIFEVFIAQTEKIPFEVILPSASKAELDDIVKESGISGLPSVIKIDVEKAEATKKSDENNIKAKITETSSFAEVNEAATTGLLGTISSEIMKTLKRKQP